jgi:ATP-dependent DNA helicase RecG
MIHGKQTNSEKEHIFAEFSKGNIDVLVATTVIEVGVNVPNATVMVIEGAERFGLSQLHQLRGRVGRGSEKSYCFLLTESNQSQTLERLTTLTETNDGFQIAQRDLEIRGPGEFLGLRQHGEITLRHVDTFNHTKMIRTVRLEAEKIMREDPNLKNDSYATIKSYVETFLESKKIILN